MWWMAAAVAALPSIDAPHKTGQRVSGEAAVVIGLEDYFLLPDVPYARRDAEAFYDFLVYTRGVPAARVQLLDGNPVKEQILAAVDQAAAEAGAGGTVWVYFAGHGAASPTTSERVLLGADVQADLAVFDARALPLATLREHATASGAKAVLVMDACYTGQGRGGADLVPGKRFAVPSYATTPASGQVLEWSAASPSQWSGPLEGAQHGAFTYTVIGALRGWADGQLDDVRDGVVTAEEADLYVQEALRSLQVRDQRPVLATADPRSWSLSRGTEAAPQLVAGVRPATAPSPAPVARPLPQAAPAAAPAPAAQPKPPRALALVEREALFLERLRKATDPSNPDYPDLLFRAAALALEAATIHQRAGDDDAARRNAARAEEFFRLLKERHATHRPDDVAQGLSDAQALQPSAAPQGYMGLPDDL